MKVLHISSGLENGGAEAALFRLANESRSHCQHQVVSLSSFGKYGELLEAKGVQVRALGLRRSGTVRVRVRRA